MIFISKVIDPWINLAFEEYLFRKKELMNVLLLYRNSSCVIIGRNQNPWTEVNIKLLNESKIPLIRRKSGGGTVFHDLGNTNYCVMMPRDVFKRSTSVTMIADALLNLDIPAKVNSRYDIVLGDKKISGSAYKIANDKSYHHGTMLIDTDLGHLRNILKPSPSQIVSKGVSSVSSPVTRLREHSFTIDHTPFCDAVIHEYKKNHNHNVDPMYFTMEDYKSNSEIQKHYKELRSWEWNYGQTPSFTQTVGKRIGNAVIKIVIAVKHGRIQDITPYDSTSKHDLMQKLKDEWLNAKYEEAVKHFVTLNHQLFQKIDQSLPQTDYSLLNSRQDK